MLILIDNYDSFTYNLVHYFGELGTECRVIRNDDMSVIDVLALQPSGIVLSPGPSSPNEAGICLELVTAAASASLPLLGVCLGHQAIGQAFGGTVLRAPAVMHGKTDVVTHRATGISADIPSPFTVMRYHSLMVAREDFPAVLDIMGESDDGVVQILQHKQQPIFGVQFHPESIGTDHGHQLLKNFLSYVSA